MSTVRQDILEQAPRRVSTPTLLQMEAVECGAAALGIISRYHNLWIPLEQLRQDCGVTRDGSKASDILKAARRLGFEAKGLRCEVEHLINLEPPAILFWNFNHFVVYEGLSQGLVHLNDPAIGPRRVTLQELEDSFTGVVLMLTPAAGFKPGGQKPSLVASLRRRSAGFGAGLRYVLFAGLLLTLPNVVNPVFARIFIDEFLIGDESWIIRPLLACMGASVLLMLFLLALQRHFLLRLQMKLALTTSAKFLKHIICLPIEFFSQRYAGEIGSRVMINDKVAKVLSDKLATSVLDSLSLVFFALVMIKYDAWLTLICASLASINLVATQSIRRSRIDASYNFLQAKGKLMGATMNGIQIMETLKATGGEMEFFERWGGYQARTIRAEQSMELFGQCLSAVPPFTKALISTAILGFGGFRVIDGQMTVGLLVAFQLLMDGFTKPISTLVTFGTSLQETEADITRLDDVLRYKRDAAVDTAGEYAPRFNGMLRLSGQVEVRDLTFGFNRLGPPLLEGLSFEIRPGQRIALVGTSGSGKSTVAKLVAGLLKPWSGTILFDGFPHNQIPPPLLHNSIGMVDQDIFMFQGTIRANVTMWDSTVPDVDLIQACKDAEIADVLTARQGGFMGSVDEGGSNFSGGQRQRLEIVRALVTNPTFLILDEATSAIDVNTERQITRHLRRRGCACLIVAHRLSTIRECDEIIVLDSGKVVERGTHESMKHAGGPYARLIRS
ncbi:MAG: NHLP family bacteriocin export ABC transporter peptidase/permease/ATPase subunit [Verrucomicrobia bacterium]|nr:NHLP family bacteriocin export ABC transporter peptidase/permease/ATPase subunit [Verrucomicrobiota bacterium]